ncbi:MAG: hypothetical protein Q8L48_08300 [Archangium sp.]|nr:hypothetical protein [Archangium sp.]
MAKPPEPIDEVLPGAAAAVLAEVSRVITQDPQQPPSGDPNATSTPHPAARQVVELKVSKVLFGSLAKAGATVQVIKPAGAYALRAGNKGPFVLGGKDVEILGRFGPDTWPEALVVQAAARHGKS